MKETLIALVGVIVGAVLTVALGFFGSGASVGTEVRAPSVDQVTQNGLQITSRRNGDTNAGLRGNAALNTATTTVCAIQSPNATSTLISGYIQENVSSTTASTLTIAKASTAFATTTLINTVSVAAGASAVGIAASTTLSALEQTNRTFAPSQWIVVGQAGGTGTFSPTGVCGAQWLVVTPNT